MASTIIQIPVNCRNCNYPAKNGVKVFAEIEVKKNSETEQKNWECPECGMKTIIVIDQNFSKEKKISRFPVNTVPEKAKSPIPGVLVRMRED